MRLSSLARASAPALLATLAAAAPASADTIGQTAVGFFGCTANSIQVQTSYAAPAAGKIDSFSVLTSTSPSTAGQQVDFLVVRRTAGTNNYTVVGRSGTETVDGSGNVQTFSVTPIEVHAGDLLGWFNVNDRTDCATFNGTGPVAGSGGKTDPAVGSTFSLFAPSGGEDLNLAANFEPTVVTGSGDTSPAAGFTPNAFTISSSGGTLSYSGGGQTFDGTITCLVGVGNAATIVAIDATTGKADRTMVQDNGATGDKLVNTLFDPSKLSAKSVAKAETCVDPDTAALSRANALPGDAIQIDNAAA
jgi:hypothetical protein